MNASIYLYTHKASTARVVAEISDILEGYLASVQAQLLPSPSQAQDTTCWDISSRPLSSGERHSLFSVLLGYIRREPVALYCRSEGAKPIRRIVADLDGCLVSEELLVRIAQEQAVYSDTIAAMTGAVDFETSFRKRVQCVRGMTASQLEELGNIVNLAPGIERFCRFTEGEDIRLDLASSNLTPYVHTLTLRLGASDYIATMPEMSDDEILDGTLSIPVVDARSKRDFALQSPGRDITPESTLVIGDGANDLEMLSATAHALLYYSAIDNSLSISDIVADLYFRP